MWSFLAFDMVLGIPTALRLVLQARLLLSHLLSPKGALDQFFFFYHKSFSFLFFLLKQDLAR